MAQVWGCKKTEGLTDKSSVLQTMARNQELTLPWAAIDTGITKNSFGAYSVAGRCVTSSTASNPCE